MDVAAGRSAGCRTILVDRGVGATHHPDVAPDDTVSDLLGAARIILGMDLQSSNPAGSRLMRT
jgi:hypothetical protein